MAKALMVNSRGGGLILTQPYPTAASTYFVMANTSLVEQSTELHAQIPYRSGGVLSNLYVKVSQNDIATGNTVVYTRKNSNNGAQSVTIAAGETGEYEDVTYTDTVTAGESWNYRVLMDAASEFDSGGTITINIIAICFAATTNTVVYYAAVGFPDLSTGSTYYAAPADLADGLNTTEAYSRFNVGASASYNNLYMYCSTHPGSGSFVVTLNAGTTNTTGTATTLTKTVTSATSFEDSAHATTIAANEYFNYSITTANTSAFILKIISIEATSTDKTFHSFVSRSVGRALSYNGTRYLAVGGGVDISDSVEADVRADINIAADVSKLVLYVGANTIS